MKFDSYQLLIMEHDLPNMEAAVGDSCAETGRFHILKEAVGQHSETSLIDSYIKNTAGPIRHPLAIKAWGFGPDQWLPRYLVAGEAGPMPFNLLCLAAKYKTIAPVVILIHSLILLLPYRIADECKIESNMDGQNSGDYLNWFCLCLKYGVMPYFCCKSRLFNAIIRYYKPETDIGAYSPIELYKLAWRQYEVCDSGFIGFCNRLYSRVRYGRQFWETRAQS